MSDMGGGAGTTVPEVEEDVCAMSNDHSKQGLRIGAIFIILVSHPSGDRFSTLIVYIHILCAIP